MVADDEPLMAREEDPTMTIQIKHSRDFHVTVFTDWILHVYRYDGSRPDEKEMYAQMERADQLIAIYGGCGFAKLTKAVRDGEFFLGCDSDPYADITDARIEKADALLELAAQEVEADKGCQKAFDLGFQDGLIGESECPFKGCFKVAYMQGWDTGFEQRWM